MKKAFTLIELLVVVLIIGILTSVALPQYRFAVAKSRVMGKMIEIDALTKAIDRYVLANGYQSTPIQKTNLLNALDIQIYRQPSDFETLFCYNGSCSIRCGFIMPSAENSSWGDVVLSLERNKNGHWYKHCTWYDPDQLSKKICESLVPLGYEISEYDEGGW